MTDNDALSVALTRILVKEANERISDEMVDRVSARALEQVAALRVPKAAVAVGVVGALAVPGKLAKVDATRRVITSLTAALVLGGGAAGTYAVLEPPHPAIQTVFQGKIVFGNADGTDSFVNPVSAQVTGIDFEYESVSWEILDEAAREREVLASGVGIDSKKLSQTLHKLTRGSYRLVFDFVDERGGVITKDRMFIIA